MCTKHSITKMTLPLDVVRLRGVLNRNVGVAGIVLVRCNLCLEFIEYINGFFVTG
jgi:hypothetical protein